MRPSILTREYLKDVLSNCILKILKFIFPDVRYAQVAPFLVLEVLELGLIEMDQTLFLHSTRPNL